jgi:hypothetical protein
VGEFPLFSDGFPGYEYAVRSAPAPGTANTKTGWDEIAASTSYDASWIRLNFLSHTATHDGLVDIGVGAAGSEKVLIPNIIVFKSTGALYLANYMFPVAIPKGTRVAIRWQASATGGRTDLRMTLGGVGFRPSASFSKVMAWGANLTDSGGTSIDPGGTVETLSAWQEILASTEADCRGLIIGIGNRSNIVRTGAHWHNFQIGVGAAGAEKTLLLIPQFSAANTGDDALYGNAHGLLPVDIPAGTRLAARVACSINDATDRLFDVVLYGMG